LAEGLFRSGLTKLANIDVVKLDVKGWSSDRYEGLPAVSSQGRHGDTKQPAVSGGAMIRGLPRGSERHLSAQETFG
jgi:hypothetical protein